MPAHPPGPTVPRPSFALPLRGVALATLLLMLVAGLTVAGGEPASSASVGSSTAPGSLAQVAQRRTKKGWVPDKGAKFNVPRVGGEPQFRLEQQVIDAINRAKPRSFIKMAMFSFDRTQVSDALIAARKRNVRVQVIVNGHELPRAQQMLANRLGPRYKRVKYIDETGAKQWKTVERKNFFYQCRASCRGDGDVQHSKFVLFTRTGQARNVVMLGSLNMKLNGSYNQFNDLLTLNNKAGLHRALDGIFEEMKQDRARKNSYRKLRIGKRFQLEVMPFPRLRATPRTEWTPARDPIIKLLAPVKCRRAKTNSGRTIIRVNMHAWDEERGRLIANRFRDLYQQGCDVRIMVGFAGGKVRRVFAAPTSRGLMPVRSTGFDTDYDGEIDLYSHTKIITINGNYDGRRDRKVVVTGSSNFQHGGQYGDELIFRAYHPGLYRQYADNWGYVWREHTHGFHWGRIMARGGKGSYYMLWDGLGTDSPEWRDE